MNKIILPEELTQIKKQEGVYCIVFNNDKYYVGRSVNIKRRVQRHINECEKKKHSNKYVERSYNKCGIKYIIYYPCLNSRAQEETLLKELFNKPFCINLSRQTIGGYSYDKNHPRYNEICKKISESNKGRKPSKETIAKTIATRKANGGYITSEETKKKISITSSGENNGMYGRRHSKESRKQMSINSSKYLEEYEWLNIETGEHILCRPSELMNNWGAPTVYAVLKRRYYTSQGWTLVN